MAWKFWKGLIVMFIIFLGLHLRTIDFNNLHFNNSSNSDSTIISNDKSVNGIYVGGDNSAKCEITINGDSWTGSTKPLTGVSDEWDNQNANVDYGTVNGKDLYDKTGSIKIGYVSGKSLHTTINGMSVTLYK